MSLFSIKYQEMLLQTPGLFEELDAFYKKLSAFLLTGHNDDGTLIPSNWIDVPFDARNFQTDSGTWTVDAADQLIFKYKIDNDAGGGLSMQVVFNFRDTTLTGVGNELRLKIPDGRRARSQEWTGFVYAFGTTEAIAVIVTRKGNVEDYLSIQRIPVTAWPNSTNAQVLRGSITFEIQG